MKFRITDAGERHVKMIESMEKQCFSMPWTAEQIRGQLGDKNHLFLAAEDAGGELLGYAGMMYIIDEGYISNVAVGEKFRRLHIASALMDELIKRALALKLSFISLEVRESNEPAKNLYSKFGFVPVGNRKNYYDFPKENAIIMTKSFETRQ